MNKKPLVEVAKVIRGVSFSKHEAQRSHRKGYVPILRAGNIGRILDTENDLVWVPSSRVSQEQYLQNGDVVIAMSSGSSDVVGKTAQLLSSWHGSVGAFCATIRFGPALLPRYGGFWLQSEIFKRWRLNRAQGVNIQNLRKSDLEQIPFPCIPKPKQREIIDVLEEVESAKRLREKTIEETNKLIQATFIEMFGDPALNPMKWPIVSVGHLLEKCEYGSSQKAKDTPPGIPMLRMNNVTADGSLHLSKLKYVLLSQRDLEKYRLAKGDVLFNRTNSRELVGKTGLWDGRFDAVPASYFIRLRFNGSKMEPAYFVAFMNLPSTKKKLLEMARGAIGQSNINAQELRSIQLSCPPIERQREFSRRVGEIEALKTLQQKSRGELGALFETLLSRFFGQKTSPVSTVKPPKQLERIKLPRRHQVTLALLSESSARHRPAVMQTQMMKYLFLTQKRGGQKAGVNRLYQFQPYNYGPFAKKVYADLNALVKKGLLEIEKRKKVTNPKDEFVLIRLTEEGATVAQSVVAQFKKELRQVVQSVVTEFGHLTHEQLLRRVYQLYPRYASKSVKHALVPK